jgi:hypothetical protein
MRNGPWENRYWGMQDKAMWQIEMRKAYKAKQNYEKCKNRMKKKTGE